MFQLFFLEFDLVLELFLLSFELLVEVGVAGVDDQRKGLNGDNSELQLLSLRDNERKLRLLVKFVYHLAKGLHYVFEQTLLLELAVVVDEKLKNQLLDAHGLVERLKSQQFVVIVSVVA